MRYLIITGEPKPEGLSQSFIQEIVKGAQDGGADVQTLSLEGIGPCRNCNEGTGPCKSEHTCAFGKDGFTEAQSITGQADAVCIIVSTYMDKLSDSLAGFMERLRRCEFGQIGALAGKPVLILIFPEASDHNQLSCLDQMDRFCRQTGAVIFDFLIVNGWNSDYTKLSAYNAGKVMAFGRKAGDVVFRKW